MNKSLVPLIMLLALIVLLTAVIINTQTIKETERGRHSSLDSDAPSIRLSPYGKPAKVKQHTRPIKPNYSEKAETLQELSLAYKHYSNGRLAEAENKLKTVLVFEPENYTALSLLGKIYYSQKKFDKAESVFRKQTRLKKSDASVYNNLGQALAKQQKYDEALKQLSTAHELDPKSPLIELNISGVYSIQGKKKESIVFFRKAFEKLGDQIIPVANDPTLDNIRREPEFKQIMKKARVQSKDADETEAGNILQK
jgi:Flp pilus assembly protein TadD